MLEKMSKQTECKIKRAPNRYRLEVNSFTIRHNITWTITAHLNASEPLVTSRVGPCEVSRTFSTLGPRPREVFPLFGLQGGPPSSTKVQT